MSLLALQQNKYGQFSDIRGFFGLHFSDGQHQWPYSNHTLAGTDTQMHPVEYPALTGLIMWLISFLVPMSGIAWLHYFWITALFHVLLFVLSAVLLKLMSNNKTSYLFVLAPAVLYSLYRNWDIWALVPMLMGIRYFDKGSYNKSAFLLAVSIATKFFPIVLLLPISIMLACRRQFRLLVRYLTVTLLSWVFINLPFAIVNFEGWVYFYKYSYTRGFGGGSLYELFSKLGTHISFGVNSFYILNLLIFGITALYLYAFKDKSLLMGSAFFVLFAFTIFNKQYSMQYVIWLVPFAVLTIYKLSNKYKLKAMTLYILWQLSELLFQYAFFQNILTDAGGQSNTKMAVTSISDFQYGIISAVRYVVFSTFTIVLAVYFYKSNVSQTENVKPKPKTKR